MTCPKCENGTLKKIQFKSNGVMGFLCDVCESVWIENEPVTVSTGHIIHSYSQENDIEYAFDDRDEKDWDHQTVLIGGTKR